MTTFERIQALIELKEKGTISDAEFKQMLELIEAEADTTQPKKTVQPEEQKKANETPSRVSEDIAALREKEILAQIINAYEKKDWKILRAKYELLKDKAAVSLEITTALFAFERRQIWLEKEEKLKREKAQITSEKKKRFHLITYGILALILIFGGGLMIKNLEGADNQKMKKYSKSTEQKSKNDDELNQILPTNKELDSTEKEHNVAKKEEHPKEINTKEPEKIKETETSQIPKEIQEQPIQNKDKNSGEEILKKFPESYLIEAEILSAKLSNSNLSETDRENAIYRIKAIHKDYVVFQNTRWIKDNEVSMRLYKCLLKCN
jgi:hypothetical protein